MGKMFKRLNGETMPQFQARIREIQAPSRKAYFDSIKPKPKRVRKAKPKVTAEQKIADHIDGLDRDDIGLSVDR